MNRQASPQDRGSILVVDDIPENLRLLIKLLSVQGYKVRVTTNGRLALKSAFLVQPDLILLDVKMPDMNGYEVCERLKQDETTCDIPIIFLSISDDVIDKIKAFTVGGVDYITKPFEAIEILARIENQLRLRQLQYQLKQQNIRLQQEIKERQYAEEQARKKAQQEQLIRRLNERIRQSLQLENILQVAVTEVQQLLEIDRVFVYRFNFGWQGDIIVESVSQTMFSLMGYYFYDSCWHEQAIQWNQPDDVQVINDVDSEDLTCCYTEFLEGLKVRASITLPILLGEGLWGLFLLHQCHQPRIWDSWEIGLLQQLTSQLSIAIQQSELYQKLQASNLELKRLITLDGLTQVSNRRRFDEYLEQEWYRSQREKFPLSLILCDADYFKNYNDYYGHLAGDDCLKKIATVLKRAAKRSTDLVARYGGEEFALLLPNTEIPGAIKVAELIQADLEKLQITHICSEVSPYMTLSLGISSMIPAAGFSCNTLIQAADKALYRAKNQGRNCYCIQHLDPEI